MAETSARQSKGRSRDPVRTRSNLLLAAREIFKDEGLKGARMSAIAKKADVPQGLIYHYFEGKEELFKAVLEEALEPYFRSTVDLLEKAGEAEGGAHPEDAPLGLLEKAIRMHFEFLRANPHVARLMSWWEADQGWQSGPLLPKEKSDLCSLPYELGCKRIREGQEQGWIRSDLDPLRVIDSFLSLSMNWHINAGRHLVESGIDPADESSVRGFHQDALEHIVELVLRGVATDKSRVRNGSGGPNHAPQS